MAAVQHWAMGKKTSPSFFRGSAFFTEPQTYELSVGNPYFLEALDISFADIQHFYETTWLEMRATKPHAYKSALEDEFSHVIKNN